MHDASQQPESVKDQIKAEVDQAPPLSPRQREHLRRIFTTARRNHARNTEVAA